MADDDIKKELDKQLDSIREVQKKTLEAMGRLKERVESAERKVKVVEASNTGLLQRVETIEDAMRMLIEGAPEKLREFLDKAAAESGDEAPASPEGSAPPVEDTPPAEVVG